MNNNMNQELSDVRLEGVSRRRADKDSPMRFAKGAHTAWRRTSSVLGQRGWGGGRGERGDMSFVPAIAFSTTADGVCIAVRVVVGVCVCAYACVCVCGRVGG